MIHYIEYDPATGEGREIDPFKRPDLAAVVRCRDCKHYKPWLLSRPENGGDCVLNKVEVDVPPDGFCAWGERRSE